MPRLASPMRELVGLQSVSCKEVEVMSKMPRPALLHTKAGERPGSSDGTERARIGEQNPTWFTALAYSEPQRCKKPD